MNNWRIIGAGGLAAWLALSGLAWATEPLRPAEQPSPAAPEQQAEKPKPGFTHDEQRRLQGLKLWLQQRKLQRKLHEPGNLDGLKSAKADKPRPPLVLSLGDDFRYSDPAALSQGSPVLHIGRSRDGRIHHRYVFNENGPDQATPSPPPGFYSLPVRRNPPTTPRP